MNQQNFGNSRTSKSAWLLLPVCHLAAYGSTDLLIRFFFIESHPLAMAVGYIVSFEASLALLATLTPFFFSLLLIAIGYQKGPRGTSLVGAMSGIVGAISLYGVAAFWPDGTADMPALFVLNGLVVAVFVGSDFALNVMRKRSPV